MERSDQTSTVTTADFDVEDRVGAERGQPVDDGRWAVIAERRNEAAGWFVFGVRTTGIYCRPGCPARTPLRVNIACFPNPEQAEAAGFRACKRCRPADVGVDPTVAAVADICRALERRGEAPSSGELAELVGWSKRHVSRRFRAVTGVTVAAYARAIRAERARASLASGHPVTESAFEAGFGSLRAFYEHGAPRLGDSPAGFREGSPSVVVTYSLVPCALGVVLVAATERGVCRVRLGNRSESEALIEGLRADYPKAVVVADDDALAEATAVVTEMAAGRPVAAADLPLDVAGTAFQVAVWEELRTLRRGEVITYKQLAQRLGKPEASRAVGSACGANEIALLVPCHRVVRSDGGLGGYRWDLDRKARLLAAEAKP